MESQEKLTDENASSGDGWYLMDKGQRWGPLSDEEFKAMAAEGRIKANAVVWRPGMNRWQTYGAYKAQNPESDEVFCSMCGRFIPREETLAYRDIFVCIGCKPAFFQRAREGVGGWEYFFSISVNSSPYADFASRAGAKLADLILLFFPFFFLRQIVTGIWGYGVFYYGLFALASIAYIMYPSFFLGRYSATPGKMFSGLIVLRSDGTKLTYGRAFFRVLTENLSLLSGLAGYAVAIFDDEKRTLHDRLCDTRVFIKR